MSSDSQPSFRAYWKGKVKKIIKPNITSYIREQLISNETYSKYQNFKVIAKNRTDFDNIRNKTKGLIPDIFSGNNNQTYPKGFYDSLFSAETDNEIYIKAAVICLWVIAILCIIPTIITIFKPDKRDANERTGARKIFFHIFLCEFLYLIYIFLSMINVAQGFQLNSFLCKFANYGMYLTIPMMYLALLLLVFERLGAYFSTMMGWTKIFTKSLVTQFVLLIFWVIGIAIIATIMFIIKYFKSINIFDRFKKVSPSFVNDLSSTLFGPYRCSVDGRLSPVFKVLIIVIFVILIVLIVKSTAVTIFYSFFPARCCQGEHSGGRDKDHHMTLLFVIFLVLNLGFSFPFYLVSMFDSILTPWISKKDTFTMKLKICFILRLSSIILQCLTFCTIERNSWSLLSILLYRGTCKKIGALNDQENAIVTRRRSTTKRTSGRSDIYDNIPSPDTRRSRIKTRRVDEKVKAAESEESTDDDSDEVFISEPENVPLSTRKPKRIADDITSNDSDESTPSPKTKSTTDDRRQTKEENTPLKKTTSKYSNTNGHSKQIPSQRMPPAKTNGKIQNGTKRRSTPSDEISNDSVSDSNDETTSRKQPTLRSSANQQKPITTVAVNGNSSTTQRNQIKRSETSRPTTINPGHIETTQKREKSRRKPKQARLIKSEEV